MAPLRLLLEVDPGEPIAGSLGHVDGPREPFSGLLELVAVLDRLRAEPPQTSVAPRPPEPGDE